MNRAVRQHQGRPRGTARRRRALHGRGAGDDRPRRLADDRVPHARRVAVLRRHLLPQAEQFLQLMTAIDDVWRNRPDDVQQNVQALSEALRRTATVAPADGLPGIDLVNAALAKVAEEFDHEWGGFGSAPKFPSTISLELVAARHAARRRRRRPHRARHHARRDGQRRHVRPHRWRLRPLLGGSRVARPALREDALRPGAAGSHLRPRRVVAARRGDRYRQVLRGDHRLRAARAAPPRRRVLLAPRTPTRPTSTATATRALFYTWTVDEVRAVLGAGADDFLEWFEFTPEGNFEGRTIPARLHHRGDLLRPDHIEAACEQHLRSTRAARPTWPGRQGDHSSGTR